MPNDLRTLVDDFATQLEQLTKRMALEQVLEALGGQAGARATPGKRRGRPPGSKNKARAGKGGKRPTADMEKLSGALLAHVKSNPGQRGEAPAGDASVTDNDEHGVDQLRDLCHLRHRQGGRRIEHDEVRVLRQRLEHRSQRSHLAGETFPNTCRAHRQHPQRPALRATVRLQRRHAVKVRLAQSRIHHRSLSV